MTVPAYARLYHDLLSKILGGQLPHGSQLPTERQLAEAYKVSIGTVRKAMDQLVQAGICTRIQGKGSFVAQYSTDKPFFYRSRTSLKGQNVTIAIRHVLRDIVPLPSEAADYLQLPEGATAIRIERTICGLDSSGMFPLAWHESYFPMDLCAALLGTSQEDLSTYSLYRLVERDCRLPISHCDEFLRICTALPEHVQQALGRPAGTSCFETNMVSMTHNEKPFEYRLSYVLSESTGIIRRHDMRF